MIFRLYLRIRGSGACSQLASLALKALYYIVQKLERNIVLVALCPLAYCSNFNQNE